MASVQEIKAWVNQLLDMQMQIMLAIGEQIEATDEMIALAGFYELGANEDMKIALAQVPLIKQKLEEARVAADLLEQHALNYRRVL